MHSRSSQQSQSHRSGFFEPQPVDERHSRPRVMMHRSELKSPFARPRAISLSSDNGHCFESTRAFSPVYATSAGFVKSTAYGTLKTEPYNDRLERHTQSRRTPQQNGYMPPNKTILAPSSRIVLDDSTAFVPKGPHSSTADTRACRLSHTAVQAAQSGSGYSPLSSHAMNSEYNDQPDDLVQDVSRSVHNDDPAEQAMYSIETPNPFRSSRRSPSLSTPFKPGFNASVPVSPSSPAYRNLQVPDSHGALQGRSTMAEDATLDKPHQSSTSAANNQRVSNFAVTSSDEVSSIMIKAGTDLRNLKIDLEQEKREVQRLHKQLGAVNAEKVALASELVRTKENTKRSIVASCQRLEEMNTELVGLKNQSQASFKVWDEARMTLPDVADLKRVVTDSTRRLETLMDENGQFRSFSEAKSAMADLRTDCGNKQQVIDLLREHLENVQAQVLDARNWTEEIKEVQRQDRSALSSNNESLSSAAKQISHLAEDLKTQQCETIDALTKNVELKSKLVSCQTEAKKLDGIILGQEKSIEVLQSENESLRQSAGVIENMEKSARSREKELVALTQSLIDTRQSLTDCKSQLAEKTVLADDLGNTLLELQERLRAEMQRNAMIVSENEDVVRRIEILDNGLGGLRTELAERKEELRRGESRLEDLQERYENQSVTLCMEKDAHGELQERLLAVDAAYKRTIEEDRKDHESKLVALHTELTTSKSQLKEWQQECDTRIDEYLEKVKILEECIKNEAQQNEKNLEVEAERASKAVEAALSSRKEIERLMTECAELRVQLDESHEKALHARPSEDQEKETLSLKVKVEALEKDKDSLTMRIDSIVSRYEKGDMSQEERKLIDRIYQNSRTMHEQELVNKGNEIRKRDNTIKTLEARVDDLQKALARRLKQSKAKVDANPANKSIIDWDLSSQLSSQSSSDPSLRAISATSHQQTHNGQKESNIALPSTSSHLAPRKESRQGMQHTSSSAAMKPPKIPTPKKLTFAAIALEAESHDDYIIQPKRNRESAAVGEDNANILRPTRRARTMDRKDSDGTAVDLMAQTPKGKFSKAIKPKARKRR